MKNFSKITKLNDKKLFEYVVEKCRKDNTFYMTLLHELTQNCPFEDACGEQYMEDHGEEYMEEQAIDYYEARNDVYD